MTGHQEKLVNGCRLPAADTLTENERAWVAFIRLASENRDPSPALVEAQTLQRLLGSRLRDSLQGLSFDEPPACGPGAEVAKLTV